MKICKECGKEKDETEFSPGQAKCRTCRNQRAAQGYKAEVEKTKAAIKQQLREEKALRQKLKADENEKNTERRKQDEDYLREHGWDENRIKKWCDSQIYRNGKRCLF